MSLFSSFSDCGSGMTGNAGLASLLYRSRATVDFNQKQLDQLVAGARLRNHERDVTGALYFEEGSFIQWLEGPPPTITRLFGRIGRDRRHTDLEVLSFGQTAQRVFGDWNLRLYRGFSELVGLDPSFGPGAAPSIADDPAELQHIAQTLARGHVGEFAIALKQTGSDFRLQARLCERLMECYAQLWARDGCTEMDTVLGLALAQTQLRLHRARFPVHVLPRAGETVLVMPVPGEQHTLGAALVQAALEEAGFTVPASLPASVDDMGKQIDGCFCNHAVIACSGVFGRWHRTPAVRQCARALREALPRSASILLYGQLAGGGRSVIAEADCDRGSRRVMEIPGLFDRLAGRVH